MLEKTNKDKTPRRWWALGPVEAAADEAAERVEADIALEQMLARNGLLVPVLW